MHKALIATAAAVVGVGVAATPASSAVLTNEHFHDAGSEPFTFCEGVDAMETWDEHVHLMETTRGAKKLLHFKANVHGTAQYVNLDTGGAFTRKYAFTDRDMRVTDNGDGTLTIIFANVGVTRWYDAEGTKVFTIAGQFRAKLVVDHGGTPNDPSDDEDVSFEILRLPKNDPTLDRDFCEDLIEFTT
jgi:hypothetical protein